MQTDRRVIGARARCLLGAAAGWGGRPGGAARAGSRLRTQPEVVVGARACTYVESSYRYAHDDTGAGVTAVYEYTTAAAAAADKPLTAA